MSTEIENNEKEELVENVSTVQAGDMLRNKREELGMSQEEIADRLRLRLSIIKSIDENNYEFDQVATFTRGYLRSYAKAVSLDEKEVLASLDGFKEAQHSDHQMQSFSRKTKREKHDSRIMKLTWVIFVVIIGISSVWWYQNQQDTLMDVSETEVPLETVADEVVEIAPALNANEPASPDRSQFEQSEPNVEAITVPATTEVSEATSVNPTEEIVEDVAESSQEGTSEVVAEVVAEVEQEIVITEVESEPVEKSDNELFLSFSADCWIQIKDADGKSLATGVKKAGTTLRFSEKAPYSIILGAPEGVSMTFANEPVNLSGYNTGKVARFTLP
jgi:cytoskeleton protein RodZ